MERAIKGGYVALAQGLGRVGDAAGLTGWLERHGREHRLAHWGRSLFAIHDVEKLIALDVPWWTYGAIDAVRAFLAERPAARVFEYGSGASTAWLSTRAASVTSVEHHEGWHARVRALVPDNVDLRLVPPDDRPAGDALYLSEKAGELGASFERYAREIDAAQGPFDLVVIDGRARAACLWHARGHLAPGGLIVFDNSHRTRYRKAIDASGMNTRRLRGLTPALPYSDETALLSEIAGQP